MTNSSMIKIEAVVRNLKLHEVEESLKKIGVKSFSSYEIKMSGIYPGHVSWRSPNKKSSDFVPKSKIEIICSIRDQEKIINAITNSARTGQTGDGIIFVCPITSLLKIKDHSTDEKAV
ncbi:MAG: P-II family nitrogen regulator [Candidatus Nitrosotenuis sp.]